jgi:branched-chain amino acid transport system permease protein
VTMATLETSQTAAAPLVAGLSLRTWRLLGLAALLATACVLPFWLTNFHLSQMTLVLIYAIALLGLNILTGFNGQISLGHGAFYAIGGYTTAILLVKFSGVPYWAVVPAAGAICLVAGFLFGLPALRLEGLYLALATFALAVATPQILKFKAWEQWTGGVQGINLDKPGAPFGLSLNADQWLYFFCLFWTVVMFVIGWNLLRGRTGRAMVAIRDHPIAASTMGINTALYKSLTFGVSAMFTGVAGSLGALWAEFVSPDSFDIFLSIRLLIGIVVGGVGSIFGVFFGAAFIEYVPNIANDISTWVQGLILPTLLLRVLVLLSSPQVLYGIALLGCVFLMPTGVAGLVRQLVAALARRLSSRRGGLQ